MDPYLPGLYSDQQDFNYSYHYDVKPKVELTSGYPPFFAKPSLHDTQVTQDQILCNEIHEDIKDEEPQR
jgi:hypothetical protein